MGEVRVEGRGPEWKDKVKEREGREDKEDVVCVGVLVEEDE